MTKFKKLEESKEHYDDKVLITTRVENIRKVHRKEEHLGKEAVEENIKPKWTFHLGDDSKYTDTKAKKVFIGVCIIAALIFLVSIFL